MVKNAPVADLLGWMESLGDPLRLRLLRLLERSELGVAELCEVLQSPQSTVSRHLKLLADESWVRHRREGTANLYRMNLDELSPPARRLWLLARDQTVHWPALDQDHLRLERVLQQRASDAQAFFSSAAGQWDNLRDQLYGPLFTQVALLSLLSPTLVVADLGCGTGAAAVALGPYVAKVIGVDQSAGMLRAARKRLAAAGLENVDLRQGDLEALPLDDETCDAALVLLVLTYVSDAPAVLRQAARVLKPGGKLVLVDLLRHDRDDFRRQMGQRCLGFDPAELEKMLTAAGFTDMCCRPLPPEPQAKGPALLLATGTKN